MNLVVNVSLFVAPSRHTTQPIIINHYYYIFIHILRGIIEHSRFQKVFMKRYGYLKDIADEGAVYTSQSLSEAVRGLQRFAGLPATGVLDAETRRVSSRRTSLLSRGKKKQKEKLLRIVWWKSELSKGTSVNESKRMVELKVGVDLLSEGLSNDIPSATNTKVRSLKFLYLPKCSQTFSFLKENAVVSKTS